MIVILIAGVVLAIIVAYRDSERRRSARWFALMAAQANYRNAQLSRQAAEIAVERFPGGNFRQDLQDRMLNELKVELERAEAKEATLKALYEEVRAEGTGLID
jgi:hypothetical protein